MTTPQGQYQGTCIRHGFPRKFLIFSLLAVTLMVWVLAVPTRRSYAIKSVIDQCEDHGYTDGMVREVAKLFPDSRALLRARELMAPPSPIAQQALSDYDKNALENRLYNSIVSRLAAEGMDLATLLVSHVGQLRFKVVLAVRTKELPYPKIQQTLKRIRTILEREILVESFRGFELAELSSFTVLNRRNGRVYEYPVLYQNLCLPYFDGEEENGPTPKPVQTPGSPVQSTSNRNGTRQRFPWGDRPWEARGNSVSAGSANGTQLPRNDTDRK